MSSVWSGGERSEPKRKTDDKAEKIGYVTLFQPIETRRYVPMNKINCSLTSKDNSRQENFWKWIDQKVQQLVACLAEKVLLLQLQAHIQAGWNQRTTDRRGYRNGYYKRNLLTPHGPLSIRVPRTRKGPLDNSLVFDKYARRIADVQRVLRHAYLLGVSTRGLAKLSEQIFGGSLSHQSISQMMRWLDTQLLQWRL